MARFAMVLVLVAFLAFSFSPSWAGEAIFATDIQALLSDVQVQFKSMGVEVNSPFCNPNHPEREAFTKDMTPATAALYCVAQYAGPVAQAAQDLRREKAVLAAQVAALKAEKQRLALENGSLGMRVKEAIKAYSVLFADNQALEVALSVAKLEVVGWKNAAIVGGLAAVLFFLLLILTFAFRRRGNVNRLSERAQRYEAILRDIAEEKRASQGRSAAGPSPPATQSV